MEWKRMRKLLYKRDGGLDQKINLLTQNMGLLIRFTIKNSKPGDGHEELEKQMQVNPPVMQQEMMKSWGAPWSTPQEISRALSTKERYALQIFDTLIN